MRTARRVTALSVLLLLVASLMVSVQGEAPAIATVAAAPSPRTIVTADANDAGTNWYPKAGISPAEVNSKDFGQIYDETLPAVDGEVAGQIYAQPVVADGVMLIVTENDNAYGVDPQSGKVEWSRHFGTPWQSAMINCGDLAPNVGTTGTPVVDSKTGVAYFTTNIAAAGGAASWNMQALSIRNGKEAIGFPVAIKGKATNAPSQVFHPTYQLQRPGLAMVGNEVYAAFGANCDLGTYDGWIVGVSTSGSLNDMWSDETSSPGQGGIWGPGGLDVDSKGNIYFATGNGGSPSPGPGLDVPQPSGIGECVGKLTTAGGRLKLVDYFCPDDATVLNGEDGDLGSGSPLVLPRSFGTSLTPNLLVEDGKSGEVYLLNRDDLGGYENGPGGTDDVVFESGPRGGVWSHPTVWPGDGGYVYIATASPGGQHQTKGDLDVYQREVTDGHVSLNWVGEGPGTPFGSGLPVVTSDGTDAGSAVIWEIVRRHQKKTFDNSADLEAFGAVPVAATGDNIGGTLPKLWKASVGNSTKFAAPLVYDGRIYVANYDGQLREYGPLKTTPPLQGSAVVAPDTVVGTSGSTSATFTATGALTVKAVALSISTPGASGSFTAQASTPVKLTAGQTFSVPITFTPQVIGGQYGVLTLTTNLGTAEVTVSGRGVPEGVPIAATPAAVNYGILPIGGTPANATVSFENTSSSPFTVQSVTLESGNSAPFSIGTLPDPLPTVQPSDSIDVPVTFTPPATSGDFVQNFNDHLLLQTTAGESTVPLDGKAAPGAQIALSSVRLNVGTVAVGDRGIISFTVGNRGGVPLTITKSKPPIAEGFSATTALAEGTVIPPHRSLRETVRFTPLTAGRASTTWVINGNDGSGLQIVHLRGMGAIRSRAPSLRSALWQPIGSASKDGRSVELTPEATDQAGAVFYGRPIPPEGLRTSFSLKLSGGSGGDGATFALASGARPPAAAGGDGKGLGLAGIPAVAIGFQTHPTSSNPDENSVGIITSLADKTVLSWSGVVESSQPLQGDAIHVTVVVSHKAMVVMIDGFAVTSHPVSLPSTVYAGFTASTGHSTDEQVVSRVQMSYR